MTALALKHLFKIAGKDGSALGSEDASLYFDGRHAIAASTDATVTIDCPQEITRPVTIAVKDLKAALLAAPSLSFAENDGRIAVNGVAVPHVPADGVVPASTVEILDLDKRFWRPVVRPFRLDGGRLGQLTGAMQRDRIRPHLNGVFLDFSTGGLAATDGRRIHLVEDAVPVLDLPQERMQGVILPGALAELLASVGGVQEVFVMEREERQGEKVVYRRVICIGAAGGKFRIREVEADSYVSYRSLFDQSRGHPVSVVLDSRGRDDILAVSAIAAANPNHPVVTLEGAGRKMRILHRDRVVRELSMSYTIGEPFAVHVAASQLSCAVQSAAKYGAAVRMRFARDETSCVYVGAQDFHALVIQVREEPERAEQAEGEAAAVS